MYREQSFSIGPKRSILESRVQTLKLVLTTRVSRPSSYFAYKVLRKLAARRLIHDESQRADLARCQPWQEATKASTRARPTNSRALRQCPGLHRERDARAKAKIILNATCLSKPRKRVGVCSEVGFGVERPRSSYPLKGCNRTEA